MSTSTFRILIAGALLVHGVGHILGFWMPARSWLFPNAGEPVLRTVSSILWVLVAAGFILSCLGFLGVVVPADWWRPLAVVFALISLLGLALFWGTWPAFNATGALGMNVVVLVTQLWLRWPPVDMFGR
jgi:hypothetical protein